MINLTVEMKIRQERGEEEENTLIYLNLIKILFRDMFLSTDMS